MPEALPLMLDRAHQAVADALAGLQASRVALQNAQRSAVGRLHQTHEQLREVTSTTEGAASEILDALDRAQGLLDELDAAAAVPAPATDAEAAALATRGGTARGALRDELFGMMHALQFQDITTQQISYTSGVLTDLEDRLLAIVEMFDGVTPSTREATSGASTREERGASHQQLYAPDATMNDAASRQQIADAIFVGTT
jgi:chemotaxis regulatin CheY-phosphate phosphatase CheZ